ncbi:MAG: hypothetical protein KJN64_05710 [Ignavibacteria bacterium]|nr:hypothetical protein [Ignavibacteria bacterium]MBT8382514.1 hypothetical protein [Ignavibacteria bacterium]MBT8391753.1 hypothetical protein [Ignavibacteria bacterium]NNJ52070.1 hypothetical protein [Ignavibacteriaceae bacterium]NNL19881.1 hypothetical protein [Ignavibacteriaceae bacterium]
MKKNSKPAIFVVIFFLVLITGILLAAQGLRFKCEELIRERTLLDGEIRSQATNRISLIASYQMFTAEDRIKEYASSKLGLIESDNNPNKKISLNKEIIRETENELNKRYE